MAKKVIILGDVHAPFHCKAALDVVYFAIETHKPDVIVQVGDLYDFYSSSAFPRSQNIMTPRQEAEEGRLSMEQMWAYIRRISPESSCFQLWGNHDVRPKKRVMEHVPYLEHFFNESFEDMMKFDGVTTLCDDKDELEIDGVVYEHGYMKFGAHFKANNKSTVTGHLHRGGVIFERTKRGEIIFELNVGYLGDPEAAALSYGRKKWNAWTQGFGIIDELGPRFCPIIL